MLFLLSPAKKLDETKQPPFEGNSSPHFLKQSIELIDILKKLSPPDLESLMKISGNLAVQNAARYSQFSIPFNHDNAKEAIFLFNGDAYEALRAYDLTEDQMTYLQSHLVMLSGLYGAVHPLDLIAPYRLEMGTALKNSKGKNLYEFWGDSVTQYLNGWIEKNKITAVVNLASNEYFSVIQRDKLSVPVITPIFKDLKNGQYKTISFNAKKARGLMVRYAAENNIHNAEDLKQFTVNDYYFKGENPTQMSEWLFYKD
ncbi:peroxide stress protein YaaA [Wohlfahrtiimonas larvae]|uniref:peroxide stress protein YaaA n=1 Tax=Wohlfahrtiimonas larvae TaxID=1157986 RepID=UPI0015C58191